MSVPPPLDKLKRTNWYPPPVPTHLHPTLNDLFPGPSYNTSKSFWLTSAVRNAVVEQPYGEFNEKTFKGITELSGVWEWIEGPFIDTMLTRSTAASAKPPYITAETNKSGYVLGLNKIVGTIQMQQLRVTDGSIAGEGCTLSGAEDITQFIPDGCYDVYGSNAASATALFTGKSSQSTTPFGTCVENRSEFQFRPAPADGSGEWFFAKFGNYDPAGYFASINALNRTSATDTINNLKKCGWFDKQTRALFVNFNMYNANYNMWIATSILFEHNAAGLVFPTSRFLTLEMDMYTTQEGVMYGALDIVLVLLSWSWVGGYVKEGALCRHAHAPVQQLHTRTPSGCSRAICVKHAHACSHHRGF